MQPSQPQPTTLSDRAMAAGLCALFVGASLAVLLVVFFYVCRGIGAQLILRGHPLHAWFACIAAAAATGFVIGSEPLPELLAHLWGTARPRRIELTLGLWAALAVVAGLAELASR